MIADLDECLVEMCSKPSTMGYFCAFHRKKDIADGLEYDDDGTIWDTCSKHHRWTLQNTHWEATATGGRRRRCKKCLAAKAKKKAAEPVIPEAPRPVEPKDPIERKALLMSGQANTEHKTPCAGRAAEFTDYTASNMPTAEEASALCEGCPFFKACGNNAAVLVPGWGVWAGKRWVYGTIYNNESERLHADD